MNKRINDKNLSTRTKKIYNSPQLSVHGNLSEITKEKTPVFDADQFHGCSN